jgi:hypothetical protein
MTALVWVVDRLAPGVLFVEPVAMSYRSTVRGPSANTVCVNSIITNAAGTAKRNARHVFMLTFLRWERAQA